MRALIIMGPTAIGKSRLGFNLARKLEGEIVSVDSRQIYRRLDIGTAKSPPEDRLKVKHHLLDIVDIPEKPDAHTFAGLARKAISDILSRNKVPILVGGSGMYLRSVTEGLFEIDLDRSSREDFSARIEDIGTAELYRRLLEIDPASGGRIHPHDRYRVVRALEVQALSGITLSEHFRRQKNRETDTAAPEYLKIGLVLPRAQLHEKINRRTLRMLRGGWVPEVEELLESGVDPRWPGMRTLGYPEVIAHVQGRLSRERMIDSIRTRTRQYAKRQMTWFRKERNVTWLDLSKVEPEERILKYLDSQEGN
ncbi:MAG: tRNA (adenosine(37)-N6)-dimethylallyltransferase MiaA [Candidatus Krumholzibacteriota bacterium]|nr:tRNA (adenosine(37)-N6)-dimethylallyltransferase MiaA [Candidatus Krumholzibacteriota bacterium]